MKPSLALTLLGVLGLAAAGCGATKKIVVKVDTTPPPTGVLSTTNPPGMITVSLGATATASKVKTGTLVRCEGGPSARVPPRGVAISKSSWEETVNATTPAPSPAEIRLTHLQNGSVRIICKPPS